jgi:hypothetical protein
MKTRHRNGLSSTRLGLEALEDRCVPATLAAGDVTSFEGKSGVQYTEVQVKLSEPVKKPVTVNYETNNGTATAGSDYTAVSGALNFDRGEIVKTIRIPIHGDQAPENAETFSVRLFGAKGATIVDDRGTVTIVDSTPRLIISTPAAADVGGEITFTVSLSAALDTPFTVDFTTEDHPYPDQPNCAYAGQDYVATSGTLTFAPGETTKTFTVQILADNVAEYDEMLFIRLSNPSTSVHITSNNWDGFTAYAYIFGEYGGYWW